MSFTVSSGQTFVASGFPGSGTVENGGLLVVPAGGNPSFALVLSGGSETVQSGAFGPFGTISDGGVLTVLPGGTQQDEVILSGGTEWVSSGGADVSATLSGGAMNVLAGGTASATTIDAGGVLTVSAGGTAELTLIGSGGAFQVLAGGTAIDTNSQPFGGIQLGGSAIISSGAVESVTSGATAGRFVTLLSGATLDVASGGFFFGAVLVDQTLDVGAGQSVDGNILPGGRETVTSGGDVGGDTLLAGAIVTLQGVSAALTIGSGGTLVLAASGATGFGTTVSSGGTLAVGFGGSADVSVFGVETVSSGGYDSGSVLYSGGLQTVLAGGTAVGDRASGGTQIVEAGGLAIDTNGGTVISSGGTIEVLSGQAVAYAVLSSGAVVSAASGGSLEETQVGSGVTLALSSGVGERNTVIMAGGSDAVGSGHTASAPIVLSGGSVRIASGGTVSSASLGSLTVSYTGSSSSTTVHRGGTIIVDLGGTNDLPTVFSGGSDVIGSGGLDSGAQISAGGSQIVDNGGSSDAPLVWSAGSITISSGGDVQNPEVNSGGTMDIGSGGDASGGGAGGLGPSDPTAFGTPGGEIQVQAGGNATDMTAISGGDISLAPGAIGDNLTVDGGILDLAAGADITGGLGFGIVQAFDGSTFPFPGGEIVIGGSSLPAVPISGFAATDTIDLAGVAFGSGGSITYAPQLLGNGFTSGVLTVKENGQTYALTLGSASVFANTPLELARDANGGTMIEVACFAAGTRISTPSGAAPVEGLRPGDHVLALADGAWRPARVRWVGCTTVDLARHPRPQQAAPIRIRAGAFADGAPQRDLLVSPDHAILVDGVLMQAQSLRNGATVVQEIPPRVTYWHIELVRHAVLCAEGLPAESYLDTGNRGLFAGEMGARPLHPDLATATRDARACAPLHPAGPRVAAAHARLLLRAAALGWRIVADPALRLVADGRDMLVFGDGKRGWHATLPAGTREVRLLSRRFVPAWFAEDDRRQLGVAVRGLRVAGRPVPRAAFASGWHAQEREWRWTDGHATLTLQPLPDPARLGVSLADAGARYWLEVPASASSPPARRSI